MKIVRTTPFPIREIETIWIPLSDGCRLAARLWLPEDAEENPVPAIIEYLPYRRGDGTAARDAVNQHYLAGHGYACLRIDIRGSGDSDGFFDDEYSPQEQADCVEAIAWIAAQPWCSGTVGMWGISWGGFNALQVAAHRPPALKAIITVCSTDDRYADDTHYMGGCLLLGNLNWGANMFAHRDEAARPEGGRRALARHLAGAARNGSRISSRSGPDISGATPIGGRARSARTIRRSNAPSSRSAAGRIPTPTPFRACSPG